MARTAEKETVEFKGDVNEQLAVLRQDIANLTSTVKDYGVAQGAHLRDAASETAAHLAQTGQSHARAVKAQAETMYSDTENAVRENPAAAVGIAAGIGFLVGMLTSRR